MRCFGIPFKSDLERKSFPCCNFADVIRFSSFKIAFQQCIKSLSARDNSILQDLLKQKLKKIISSTEILEDIDNTFIKS